MIKGFSNTCISKLSTDSPKSHFVLFGWTKHIIALCLNNQRIQKNTTQAQRGFCNRQSVQNDFLLFQSVDIFLLYLRLWWLCSHNIHVNGSFKIKYSELHVPNTKQNLLCWLKMKPHGWIIKQWGGIKPHLCVSEYIIGWNFVWVCWNRFHMYDYLCAAYVLCEGSKG